MGRVLFYLLIALVFVWLLGQKSKIDNENNVNVYILKTCVGDIWCNYHNSRDTTAGYILYVDYSTKRDKYIERSCVDSVIIVKEDFWTCGPKDQSLKYIDQTTNK